MMHGKVWYFQKHCLQRIVEMRYFEYRHPAEAGKNGKNMDSRKHVTMHRFVKMAYPYTHVQMSR